MQAAKKSTDVVLAGTGPAGLACALELARHGVKPVLIGKKPALQPARTVALMQGSVALLRHCGVWDRLQAKATPLTAIRLVDDTKHLFRSPTVTFHAHELGLSEFGFNIVNDDLQQTLQQAALDAGIEIIEDEIHDAIFTDDGIELRGKNCAITARVAIAADGRNSLLREKAGFQSTRRAYPQMAVTAILNHSVPHNNVSTEFHTRFGPMTFVPMQNDCSSLVLVTTPDDAKKLADLSENSFCDEIRNRTQSMLGKFEQVNSRGCWPLEMLLPQSFAQKRVLLAGEAAHVLPPIGAQGLNLGFRDACSAAFLISAALSESRDPGGGDIMAAYNRSRSFDIRLRSFAVDQFNRSLLTPFLPIHFLRGFGLFMAQKSPYLRQKIMQMGLGEFSLVYKPQPNLDTRRSST